MFSKNDIECQETCEVGKYTFSMSVLAHILESLATVYRCWCPFQWTPQHTLTHERGIKVALSYPRALRIFPPRRDSFAKSNPFIFIHSLASSLLLDRFESYVSNVICDVNLIFIFNFLMFKESRKFLLSCTRLRRKQRYFRETYHARLRNFLI